MKIAVLVGGRKPRTVGIDLLHQGGHPGEGGNIMPVPQQVAQDKDITLQEFYAAFFRGRAAVDNRRNADLMMYILLKEPEKTDKHP